MFNVGRPTFLASLLAARACEPGDTLSLRQVEEQTIL
jgi:hypothetical protein